MRPVDRGPWPLDKSDARRDFRDHSKARRPLVERIGDFCSYCEIVLPSSAQVEHVLPKSVDAQRAGDWENFLLACLNCNATKGKKELSRADGFWPDRDNTFRAFVYSVDQVPQVSGSLSEADQARARRVLELLGLDREKGHPLVTKDDWRWGKRREAWGMALNALRAFQESPTDHARGFLVASALSIGFFSVWMTAFQAHPGFRVALIQAFRGTAPSCFDSQGDPVPRPGGAI